PRSLPSFPTRRSSDLFCPAGPADAELKAAEGELARAAVGVEDGGVARGALFFVGHRGRILTAGGKKGAVVLQGVGGGGERGGESDRKSTRLNSSHEWI